MRSFILYGATHLLFAAALAIDPDINLMRVHEHIQYNRDIVDDVPSDAQAHVQERARRAGPITTAYTDLVLMPTQAAHLTASPIIMAPVQAYSTIYEFDDEDSSDEGDDTDVWPAATAPAVNDPCAPTVCAPPPPPPPPSPPPPPCVTATAPPPCVVTVTAQPDGCAPTAPAPAPSQYCDDTEEDDTDSCDEPVYVLDSCDPPIDDSCDPPPIDDSCDPPAPPPADDSCDPPAPPPVDNSCTPPPTSCCGGGSQFEHQYGDDAVNWVVDTKEHARNRVEHARDCAERQVSHFAPGHIHDRISQVLHDRRPVESLNHVHLHQNHGRLTNQQRRAMNRRARHYRNIEYTRDKNNYRHSYQNSGYTPVRRPSRVYRDVYERYPQRRTGAARTQPNRNTRQTSSLRTSVRDSAGSGCGCGSTAVVRDTSSCGCGAAPAVLRDTAISCGCSAPAVRVRRPVRRDPCSEQKATSGCGGCSDIEHQYGDDTMDFILDTKDHTRNFLGRMGHRAMHALSHFAPGHVHDRVDQFVHDERPERSEDHLELHENHGYLS